MARSRSRIQWTAVGAFCVVVVLSAWLALSLRGLPDPKPLATSNPRESALMRQRTAEAAGAGRQARRRQSWVALDAVTPWAVQAVVLSEDASFYQHEGIDTVELRKALAEAWRKKGLGRGASTITQQLAKNLWLSGDRSLWRKVKELVLAKRLEEALTKKRILALYLNVVEWGEGVYGIDAGAREHFGVSASELSLAQSLVMASMLPAPRRWTPASRSKALQNRSLRLLGQFATYGKISPEQATGAREQLQRMFGDADDIEDESQEGLEAGDAP